MKGGSEWISLSNLLCFSRAVWLTAPCHYHLIVFLWKFGSSIVSVHRSIHHWTETSMYANVYTTHYDTDGSKLIIASWFGLTFESRTVNRCSWSMLVSTRQITVSDPSTYVCCVHFSIFIETKFHDPFNCFFSHSTGLSLIRFSQQNTAVNCNLPNKVLQNHDKSVVSLALFINTAISIISGAIIISSSSIILHTSS